jgi:hypothetical protein
MLIRRTLWLLIMLVLFVLEPILPIERPRKYQAMTLHARAAMSRRGRRLAEIVGTDPFTLYVGGVEVRLELGDEPSSVWLLLGGRPERFRATPIGKRRYDLTMAGGDSVAVGVTRRLRSAVTQHRE